MYAYILNGEIEKLEDDVNENRRLYLAYLRVVIIRVHGWLSPLVPDSRRLGRMKLVHGSRLCNNYKFACSTLRLRVRYL